MPTRVAACSRRRVPAGQGTDIAPGVNRGGPNRGGVMLVDRGSGGRVRTPEISAVGALGGAEEFGTSKPWAGGAWSDARAVAAPA